MILEKAILTVNKIQFILSFVIVSNEIKFMYNYQKRKKINFRRNYYKYK